MKKAIELTHQKFDSSTHRTPEYLHWHRTFRREFVDLLVELGATRVMIGKPNHFDLSGFFEHHGQLWYVRIEDLRWSKDNMLIRTAAHERDYIGGINQYVSLANAEAFELGLRIILGGNSGQTTRPRPGEVSTACGQ